MEEKEGKSRWGAQSLGKWGFLNLGWERYVPSSPECKEDGI